MKIKFVCCNRYVLWRLFVARGGRQASGFLGVRVVGCDERKKRTLPTLLARTAQASKQVQCEVMMVL